MTKLSQGLAWVAGVGLLALSIVRMLGSEDAPKQMSAIVSQTAQRSETTGESTGQRVSTAATAEPKPEESGPKPRTILLPWTARKHYRNTQEAMSALLPAAESGDTKAMIGIALALHECRFEPPSPDELKFMRQSSDFVLDGDDEATLQHYEAAFDGYCTLPHDEVFSSYRHWLLKAADAGDSEAQLLASLVPPFDDHYREKALQAAKRGDGSRFDPLGGETRQLAIKYAHLAMDQGEVWGVFQARLLENSDESGEKNPVDFYLYNWLMSRIPKSDGSYGGWDKQIEWAGKPLLQIDKDLAVERGQAVLAKTSEWIWRPRPSELFDDRDVKSDR